MQMDTKNKTHLLTFAILLFWGCDYGDSIEEDKSSSSMCHPDMALADTLAGSVVADFNVDVDGHTVDVEIHNPTLERTVSIATMRDNYAMDIAPLRWPSWFVNHIFGTDWRHSDFCITADTGHLWNTAGMWPCDRGGDRQKFYIERRPDGYSQIRSAAANDRCLQVRYYNVITNPTLKLAQCDSSEDKQAFYIAGTNGSNSSDVYILAKTEDGRALEAVNNLGFVEGQPGSTLNPYANSFPMHAYFRSKSASNDDQRWILSDWNISTDNVGHHQTRHLRGCLEHHDFRCDAVCSDPDDCGCLLEPDDEDCPNPHCFWRAADCGDGERLDGSSDICYLPIEVTTQCPANCPEDCPCNFDGSCDPGENNSNCPSDCVGQSWDDVPDAFKTVVDGDRFAVDIAPGDEALPISGLHCTDERPYVCASDANVGFEWTDGVCAAGQSSAGAYNTRTLCYNSNAGFSVDTGMLCNSIVYGMGYACRCSMSDPGCISLGFYAVLGFTPISGTPDAPRVDQVPRANSAPAPAQWFVDCNAGPDTLEEDTHCDVLVYNGIRYWAYSHYDNRFALLIAGFDSFGELVGTVELFGARYAYETVISGNNAIFRGQSNYQVTIALDDLPGQ